MNKNIIAIVVTFNRKKFLLQCLKAIYNQTCKISKIIVVDNASTDGTYEYLINNNFLSSAKLKYIRLNRNLGGSGGFFYGIKFAMDLGAEWIWMMDDDALPDKDALKELSYIAKNPMNIYGSTPCWKDELSWGVKIRLKDGSKKYIEKLQDMAHETEVEFIPFLGIYVHRQMIKKIGYPEKDFFIAADDVEYTLRAKKAGSKLIQAGKSYIIHPPSSRYQIKILGNTIYCLKLPAWKRYYDTRNRILIARKHYGYRLITETFPGLLVRFFGTLIYEPRKGIQSWAFLAGFIDGILGKKGYRHEMWRILN